MKIGVFDSGIGGLSVANALKKALPGEEIIFKNDAIHVPYGTKSPEQLLTWVPPILNELISDGCGLIVIACNTVSTTIIDELRKIISVPLINVEPMVKEAAGLTKSGVIAVCATRATIGSHRYAALKREFAENLKVLEPDCSDWVLMIEKDEVDNRKLKTTIDSVCEAGADVIVLGCTHYHWVEELVTSFARNRALIIQPEQTVIKQVRQAIGQLA